MDADKAGTTCPARQRRANPSEHAATPKRTKRTPNDVIATANAFLAYVKAHDGQRVDQIAKGMGTSTEELKLPVQKLFAVSAIKKKGQRRGTKYFAR